MKIQENSEKIWGPPGDPEGPSTTIFRPLKKFRGPLKILKILCSVARQARGPSAAARQTKKNFRGLKRVVEGP